MPPSRDKLARRSAPNGAIALVVDGADWHARQLRAAFAARGVRATLVKLPDCAIETQSASGLALSGFGGRLPDAVFVRGMAGAPFETITLRLGILHALREAGVPVWNDARAIERCIDKSMTSFLLARAGLPTPATWVTESLPQAQAIV